MTSEEWPMELTSIKFQIKSNTYCRIQYIAKSNKVEILDWDDNQLLNHIHLDDVIGVDLETVTHLDSIGNIDDDLLDPNKWEESKNTENQNEIINDNSHDTKCLLNIYSYPHEKDKKERIPHHITLNAIEEDTNWSKVRSCVHKIRTLAKLGHCNEIKPPCYLVIVNPFSGKGIGKEIYDDMLKVMLDQSGIDHRVLITTHAGHATERMSKRDTPEKQGFNNDNLEDTEECDISCYDAVIVVGGDGILHEILQGIHRRPDTPSILSSLKFGIVGTGTCNGLAKSLQHASHITKNEYYTIRESIFLICKGLTSLMDLALYHTLTKKESYLGFLTFSWAIISDIDFESEILRFIGSFRMELWSAWRCLNLKTYHGIFSYLPPSSAPSLTYDKSVLEDSDLTPEWKTIKDEFILFWVSQVTHASYNVHNSPSSKLNDGLFKALIIRKNKCSRLKLILIMLKLEFGTHAQHEEGEVYDCFAFRLEPIIEGSLNNLVG